FCVSSRRRHTRSDRDWSSDVCSSDLGDPDEPLPVMFAAVNGKDEQQIFMAMRQHVDAGEGHLAKVLPETFSAKRQREEARDQRQIGRASCREREESSGGGVKFKKKVD